MKRYVNGFQDLLDGFDFETIENDANSIFALSPALTLIYLNPAWFTFAHDNGGTPSITDRFGIGTPFAEAINSPRVLKFYVDAFRAALANRKVWSHDYECSSPQVFRLYHETVYPFRNRQGLLVMNSLIVHHPHSSDERPPFPADHKLYRTRTGVITQCCNCRRTQRTNQPEFWDWVPAWVERPPRNASGGICPTCYDYYWKNKPNGS